MSQEPSYNKNEKKNPRIGNNRPAGEDPNQQPRKGPKFSIYWIYAIIFAVLIGFQLFGTFSVNMTEISQDRFVEMLTKGDIASYKIVSNRNRVKVTLKETSIPTYDKDLKKGSFNGKTSKEGPHMYFNIGTVDSFKDDMRQIYTANPGLKGQAKELVETESDWFSKSLSFLLPILLFVGLWILLMRIMGGASGGGGG